MLEVQIKRNGFANFFSRAATALALADTVTFATGPASTTITITPASQKIRDAIWAALENGESISVGAQTMTKVTTQCAR